MNQKKSFEIVMDKNFSIDFKKTAVIWLRNEKCINAKENTIAAIKIPKNILTEKDFLALVAGKEASVFEYFRYIENDDDYLSINDYLKMKKIQEIENNIETYKKSFDEKKEDSYQNVLENF